MTCVCLCVSSFVLLRGLVDSGVLLCDANVAYPFWPVSASASASLRVWVTGWRWQDTGMSNRYFILPGSSSNPRLWRQTVARRRRIANDASGRRAWNRVGCWRRKCQHPTEDHWPNRRTSSKTSTPSSKKRKKWGKNKRWLHQLLG